MLSWIMPLKLYLSYPISQIPWLIRKNSPKSVQHVIWLHCIIVSCGHSWLDVFLLFCNVFDPAWFNVGKNMVSAEEILPRWFWGTDIETWCFYCDSQEVKRLMCGNIKALGLSCEILIVYSTPHHCRSFGVLGEPTFSLWALIFSVQFPEYDNSF